MAVQIPTPTPTPTPTPALATARHWPDEVHAPGGAIFVRMHEVPRSPVRWLWPGLIPRGKLTLLAGECGVGKSVLALDLAARVSRGRPMPTQPAGKGGQPGDVLLIVGEDDPRDTVAPRLLAADADLARIAFLTGVRDERGRRTEFHAADDIVRLSKLLDHLAKGDAPPRLVVIDPLNMWLTRRTPRRRSVRTMLDLLGRVAFMHGVAMLVVTHLNKPTDRGRGHELLYRTMGSVLLAAAARSVLMLVRDPADPGPDGRRLLVPGKLNVAAARHGAAMRIVAAAAPGAGPDMPVVAWDDQPVAPDALAVAPPRHAPRFAQAVLWLEQTLADGPMPYRDILDRASAEGISPITLRRAREAMDVLIFRSDRPGDGQSVWSWRLPHPQGAKATCSPKHAT